LVLLACLLANGRPATAPPAEADITDAAVADAGQSPDEGAQAETLAIAESLASSCELSLAVRDIQGLDHLVARFAQHKDAMFAAVYDSSGNLLASAAPDLAAWLAYQEAGQSGDYLFVERVVTMTPESSAEPFSVDLDLKRSPCCGAIRADRGRC